VEKYIPFFFFSRDDLFAVALKFAVDTHKLAGRLWALLSEPVEHTRTSPRCEPLLPFLSHRVYALLSPSNTLPPTAASDQFG